MRAVPRFFLPMAQLRSVLHLLGQGIMAQRMHVSPGVLPCIMQCRKCILHLCNKTKRLISLQRCL